MVQLNKDNKTDVSLLEIQRPLSSELIKDYNHKEAMKDIHDIFLQLEDNYLFSNVAKKTKEYQKNNPDKKIIKLGIGDVTRPIVPSVVKAMHKAVDEVGTLEGFKGYGPEQGYEFLRKAIIENEYKELKIDLDEIFVSDGAKCDTRQYW